MHVEAVTAKVAFRHRKGYLIADSVIKGFHQPAPR